MCWFQGGWNNNPSTSQFQAIFFHLMVWCGVSPSETCKVAAQDETVSLAAVEKSSSETAEEQPSPFADILAVERLWLITVTHLHGLMGWWKMPKSTSQDLWCCTFCESCPVAYAVQVRDAVPVSYDPIYHLLTLLKKSSDLLIPSQGIRKVHLQKIMWEKKTILREVYFWAFKFDNV